MHNGCSEEILSSEIYAEKREQARLPGQKEPGIFGDVKTVRDLSLHKGTEFVITVQQQLVLIPMTGKNIFNQRLGAIQLDRIFVIPAGDVWKIRGEQVGTVFQPKPLIQLFRREYDAAVKFLHKCADFTHMPSAIGTAKKAAAFFQNTAHLRKDPAGLLAVEQDMIGDDEIKALVRIRNLMAVKGAEGKAGVGSSDASARIPKHAGRHIGECDGK